MESIGLKERIREFREARGLSQVSLAKSLNIHPQTIRDYESGKRTPPIKALPPLARELSVTVVQLIEGVDELPQVKVLPVSAALKRMMAIPDDIYDMAGDLEMDEEAWENIKLAFRAEIKSLKNRKAKNGEKAI